MSQLLQYDDDAKAVAIPRVFSENNRAKSEGHTYQDSLAYVNLSILHLLCFPEVYNTILTIPLPITSQNAYRDIKCSLTCVRDHLY